MKHHNLRIFKKHFKPLIYREMTAQVRFNDRDYQVDDIVTFHEGQQELEGFDYTGQSISARISNINDYGCQPGYVNLSLSDVGLVFASDYPEFLKEQA